MKKTFISMLLATALAPLSLAEAERSDINIVENYAAVAKSTPEDGFVVATYADGWDKFSKKTVQQFYKNKAMQAALKNSAVIEYAAPNLWVNPDKSNPEATHSAKEREAKLGLLKWSGPHTYPAYLLYDKDGRHYATVLVPYSDRKNPEKIAKQITEARKALAEQNELMAQAAKADGQAKAKLLGKAASFTNINRPDNIVNQIKAVDREDKSGFVRRLEFNGHGYAEGTAKTEDWKATLAEVEKKIADKSYTDVQRQGLYATAVGLLHRHGSMADQKKLIKYLREMEKIDPKSILGISADHAQLLWVSELSYADGWSPAVLPTDTEPTELKGPLPIKAAGTYTVTFTYSRGSHKLVVLGVELYDGGKKVAEDKHRGSTGTKHENNVYTLEVGAKVKDPVLKVIFDMKKDRDSYGSIKIEKK